MRAERASGRGAQALGRAWQAGGRPADTGGSAGGRGACGRRTLGRRAGQGAASGAGARGRARRPARARGAGLAGRWARGLGAQAGLGLCTRCTRPVFGPVRLGIFLSQNFWTLFVNPVHEHCSSRNFLNFFFKI